MESSDEIRDAMLEVVDAYERVDDQIWRQLWSNRPGVMSLGTDPREWWESAAVVVALDAQQFGERGPARFTEPRIAAFQEGSVGWAVFATQTEWAGGREPFRMTGIFHLERGAWRLVHLHRSFGIHNEDLGVRLTTGLESIAETVSRERVDLTRAIAPNGTVTILFTDIEGSTQLMDGLGDAAWMQLLHSHNAVVRDHLAAHRGFEVKSQGDGFMLAFDSAMHALRCSIGIQQALAARDDGLRVRIGLHTAEAIREADDFYGKGVVLAARIASEARGGEILVSSLLHELVDGSAEFSFEDPVEVELKGLSGLRRLYAVRWHPE